MSPTLPPKIKGLQNPLARRVSRAIYSEASQLGLKMADSEVTVHYALNGVAQDVERFDVNGNVLDALLNGAFGKAVISHSPTKITLELGGQDFLSDLMLLEARVQPEPVIQSGEIQRQGLDPFGNPSKPKGSGQIM